MPPGEAIRMKRTLITLLLATALVAVAVPVQANDDGPNEEQTGRSVDCQYADKYGLLRVADGVLGTDVAPTFNGAHGEVVLTQTVTVDGGTNYTLSADDGSEVRIDFFNETGDWIESGGSAGTAPESAERGSVCVSGPKNTVTAFFKLANPATTFHYQDGFPNPS